MKIFLILAILICPIAALGSGMGMIAPVIRSLKLEAEESGYNFSLTFKADRSLESIEVIWGNTKTKYEDGDLAEVKQTLPQKIVLKSPYHIVKKEDGEVFFFLPYSAQRDYDGDDEIVYYNIVRFHFIDGKLVEWVRSEISDLKKRQWTTTGWDSQNGLLEASRAIKDYNPLLRL